MYEAIPSKPFLKWVGGKTQLLPVLREHYPQVGSDIDTYVEPFIGAGAVLLDVLPRYDFKTVVINDINKALVNTYKVIRDEPDSLLIHLDRHVTEYLKRSEEEKAEFFYSVRNDFNENQELNSLHAAQFIFLNKTCFNGLYRVNKAGKFNVPHGKYKNPTIYTEDSIHRVSRLLKDVTITSGGYQELGEYVTDKAFFYFDPPYRPLSSSANFNSYDSSGFGDAEQRELAHFVKSIADKGAKILLSNSDPKNTNPDDEFFDQLYSGFKVERVSAKRVVSSKASTRGAITEILVSN